jgi:hypothetical protein
MLSTDPAQGSENQDQKELGVSQGTLHGDKYPYIDEFSGFIASVSTDALKYKLMTHQQRALAKSVWEAENYGGSKSKCIQHLKEIYGPHWDQVTSISDHFTEERNYCEYVLILDHMRQWDKQEKLATLRKTTAS